MKSIAVEETLKPVGRAAEAKGTILIVHGLSLLELPAKFKVLEI